MNLVSKYISLITILIFVSINFATESKALDWPSEYLSKIQSEGYGRLCTNCTAVFSRGYCAPTCCDSCQSAATRQNLNIPQSCNGVCELPQTPTADDENFEKKCKDSNYSLRGCDQLKQYTSGVNSEEFKRRNQRRDESCNEGIQKTKDNCQESKLDQAYPFDLFNLAKNIVESPSCDFAKVEDYNLQTAQANPSQVIGACDQGYNMCKKYCFDENTVYQDVNGQQASRTNTLGQVKYEEMCKPLYAKFSDKKAIREEFISKANETVLSCKSSEVEDDDGPIADLDDGSATTDTATGAPAKTKPADPNLAVNNPEVAMNNINGLITAFQPFIPVNQGNYNPSLYNSAKTISPTQQRYGLTDSEMYGPDYSGWNAKDADAIDYMDEKAFDRPQSLKQNTNNQNRNNNMNNSGSGMGALGGSSSGPNSKSPNNKPGRASAKGKSKNKTLFGKVDGDLSNTYTTFPESKSGNRKANLNNSLDKGRSSLFNGERKFDAAKYHRAIMSSYQKGIKSKAQIRAERRAAGYSLESRDEKMMRGYSLWHQENKIHPETISLFMQAKICYHTKFSSNFKSTCEFSKP